LPVTTTSSRSRFKLHHKVTSEHRSLVNNDHYFWFASLWSSYTGLTVVLKNYYRMLNQNLFYLMFGVLLERSHLVEPLDTRTRHSNVEAVEDKVALPGNGQDLAK
jgi:hypothetical protein